MLPENPDLDPDDLSLNDAFSRAPRDENTDDMFGVPSEESKPQAPIKTPQETSPSQAYTVLARKYRPRLFEDLIGQDVLVRTLSNAFSTGRIAHGFMLTGVRGVGKTTTARLLARALNYQTDEVNRPSVHLETPGRFCQAIIEGRHMDVLELDAASRTGVEAMRELLDTVWYAPTEARFKVYVIDEVHMLSTGAFNALLKTLEEPPPHVKFIFATTEIRKVPVTILSRCQRFDLRRVEPDILTAHLKKICALEGFRLDDDSLNLIARAAEGSVRDGLSLLDQALVFAQGDEKVDAKDVRDMLGLADRGATLDLFEHVCLAQFKEALSLYQELYGFGADPLSVLNDLIDYSHQASIARTLSPEATRLADEVALRLARIANDHSLGMFARLYSVMIKAIDELKKAPDSNVAMEMQLIRLCYMAELPPPEDVMRRLDELKAGAASSGQSSGVSSGVSSGWRSGGGPHAGGAVNLSNQRGNMGVVATSLARQEDQAHQLGLKAKSDFSPMPQSFEQVLSLIEEKRDLTLFFDVQNYVRFISIKAPSMRFSLQDGAPNALPRRLSQALSTWTGTRWLLGVEEGGGLDTYRIRHQKARDEASEKLRAHPFVLDFLKTFPGGEILHLRPKFTADASGFSHEGAPLETNQDDQEEND